MDILRDRFTLEERARALRLRERTERTCACGAIVRTARALEHCVEPGEPIPTNAAGKPTGHHKRTAAQVRSSHFSRNVRALGTVIAEEARVKELEAALAAQEDDD